MDQDANDGREVAGWLPTSKGVRPVVQVIEDATGEVLYTTRAKGATFQPRVYSKGKHTVKIGRQKPTVKTLKGLAPSQRRAP